MESRMYKQQRKRRRIWPWVAGSVALHLLVLTSLPGVDSPARCPAVMLVSLVSDAAEPAKVVMQQPVAPPQALLKGSPRRSQTSQRRTTAPPAVTRRQPSTQTSRTARTVSVPPTPIITSNTTAANTIPVPQPAEVTASAETSIHGTASPHVPSAPAPGSIPSGTGGQGGTADIPAPVPAKPAVDVKALMRSYGAGAISKVQRTKFYPDSLRDDPERSGTTVSVRVKFKVSRDGTLLSVSASSGVPELSSAAEQAVRNAAPFGSFPAGVERSNYPFTTTLEYKLR
jgi:TonB family protein